MPSARSGTTLAPGQRRPEVHHAADPAANGSQPSPRPILVPGGGARSARGRLDDDPEELVVVHDRSSGLHAAVSIQSTVLGPALGGCRFHPYDTDGRGGRRRRAARAGHGRQGLARRPRPRRWQGGHRGRPGDRPDGAPDAGVRPPRRPARRSLHHRRGRRHDHRRHGSGRHGHRPRRGPVVGRRRCRRPQCRHRGRRRWSPCGPPSTTSTTSTEPTKRTTCRAGASWSPGSARWAVRWCASSWPPVPASSSATSTTAAVASVLAELPVEVVDPDRAVDQPCDVFAPCALGGVIGATTIPRLRCRAVVGSANNQLVEPATPSGSPRSASSTRRTTSSTRVG